MTAPIKPLLRNKRGMDYYVFIVSIVGVLMLSFITFSLFTKQYGLSSGLSTGTEQFRLLKVYATGGKALLFVDDAAKLAIEQAAYDYGKRGFYAADSPCLFSGGVNYWARGKAEPGNDCVKVVQECYPDKSIMDPSFIVFFTLKFGDSVSAFNKLSETKLPLPVTYEPFRVSPVVGRTEVVGIAKEPVSVVAPNVKYEVKPSFRESIDRDIIGDGVSVVAVAKQLAGKSEKDAKNIVSAADSDDAGKLDWDENFPYTKASSACPYPSGSCSCCETVETCGEYEFDEFGDPVLDEEGKMICKKKGTSEVPVDDGTEYRTIPYDSFDIPMAVKVNDPASGTGHKQYFVYDEAAKKVVLKELEYNFAVNWVEDHPEDSTTSCSCGTGHPC